VAATKGQSVRRADFFFFGESRVGGSGWCVALAVANCDGFLLEVALSYKHLAISFI
jgi:hypothetical protein